MLTQPRRPNPPPPDASDGRVFVVDDDASVRRALVRLLRSAGLPAVAFADAEAFLSGVDPADAPACLLVDLSLPGLSGLGLQARLLERGVELSVVFISGRASLESGVRAMKAGAVDFLEKPLDEAVLLAAVRRALEQDRVRRAERAELARLQARLQRLTPREREVCGLIVSGLLNKQAAAELGTAEKTVKVHRARVMKKMEAASLADLVRMASRLGLVTRPGR